MTRENKTKTQVEMIPHRTNFLVNVFINALRMSKLIALVPPTCKELNAKRGLEG